MKTTRLLVTLIALLGVWQGMFAENQAYAYLNNGKLIFRYDDNWNDFDNPLVLEENEQAFLCEYFGNNVTQVIFEPSFNVFRPKTTAHWFSDMNNLESITGLEYLNTEAVTEMHFMFNGCSKLTSLDLTYFNTEKVSLMQSMFAGCSRLKKIYAGNWNIEREGYFNSYGMFAGCENLVGAISYNENNANDITFANPVSGYFSHSPQAYAVLDANGLLTFYYDTNKSLASASGTVYDIPWDFGTTAFNHTHPGWYNTNEGEDNLNTTIQSVAFDASFKDYRLVSAYDMFYNCTALTSIDFRYFNTSSIMDMSYMFSGCTSLQTLDLTAFNTENVQSMTEMFSGCSSLTTIYCNDNWYKPSIVSNSMFSGCTQLVGAVAFDTNNDNDVTFANPTTGYFTEYGVRPYAVLNNGTLTFYYDDLKETRDGEIYPIPWNSGDPEDWDDPEWVIYEDENGNTAITSVAFDDSFSNYRLESAFDMFATCTALTSIDFTNFNTSSVTTMSGMFFGCRSLTTLDLSSFDTDQVENMEAMFAECSALTNITFGDNFNTENVTSMGGMFASCNSLTSLDLSNFNTENVTYMGGMFDECEELAALSLSSSFKTSNVEDMSYMFYDCKALTILDLSNFVTSNATHINEMFYGCSNLTTIYCNNDWYKANIISENMFLGCTQLVGAVAFEENNANDVSYANPTTGYFTGTGLRPYAVLTSDGTLTFYYDENSAERANDQNTEKIFYNFVWDDEEGSFNRITTATFDASFRDYPITSTASMFERLQYLTTINGLEYLNTSNVTDMSYMFNLCYSLQTLDLTSFNTSNVGNMEYMFNECSSLNTIYCNDDWNQSNILCSDKMFFLCENLPNYSDFDITKANPTTGYFTYALKDKADNSSLIANINNTRLSRVGLVGRTLSKTGVWNSLCLPFSLTARQLDESPLVGYTELRTLEESSSFESSTGTLTLTFTPTTGDDAVTSIEAGKPYIIKWNGGENIVNPTFNGVTIVNSLNPVEASGVTFMGSFDPQPFTSADDDILYIGNNNKLYFPNRDMTIGSFRAWFQLTEGSASQIKAINLNFGDEENGIKEITTDSGTSSTSNPYFTLDGRRLNDKPATAGIYIHNGRKIMIK